MKFICTLLIKLNLQVNIDILPVYSLEKSYNWELPQYVEKDAINIKLY